MSEIPHARPVKDNACEVMFSRTMFLSHHSQPVFALSSYDAAAFATMRLAEP
jgi:hypothetical protein